ncbi:MAG: CBS domain-containing protein [Thermodesulfovibrionales bacterium]
MVKTKVSKDLMIDVFEYPHVPYWFTVRQAITVIKKSLIGTEKCVHPLAVLVFDEKYNILGTLTLKDVLKGLDSREKAERPVSEVMVPAKHFVEPDDPVSKAADLMLNNDLVLLPVIENKKKFVGVIRMIEIFDELTSAIL